MTTAALLGHVTAYAAQVRTHLSDLPSEQVDDLTDGLEADLAEALADPDARPVTGEVPTVRLPVDGTADTVVLDLAARFGDPADYAAELRTAAGLPLAPEAGGPDLGPTRWEEIVAWWGEQKEAATGHPAWPSVSSFALAVRPAWWVARGWVLFGILFSLNSTEGTVVAPGGLLEWIVFLGLVWLSVEYGRGRRALPRPVRRLAVGLSVVAAVFLLPGVAAMAAPDEVRYEDSAYSDVPPVDGVYVDGSRVTNLFVYDADGEYVQHAQVLDNQGRAVRVDEPDGLWIDSEATVLHWAPLFDVDGREVPNAYPVPTVRSDSYGRLDDLGTGSQVGAVTEPAPPVRSVAPLDVDTASTAAEPEVDPDGPAEPTDPTSTDPATDTATTPPAAPETPGD